MVRLRVAAAALAAAALLGACDDDPEPRVQDPTPSATPTSSAATSTAPTTQPTPPPVDAVKRWVAERNEALLTGDTGDLRSLTDLSCESCVRLIASIEEVYAAGGSYDTAGWTVEEAKERGSTTERAVVDTAIEIAGGTTIEAAGADPVVYGPENRFLTFKLHQDGDALVVDFVGFVS